MSKIPADPPGAATREGRARAAPLAALLLAALANAAPPARAETTVSPTGFVVTHTVVVPAAPDVAWRRLVQLPAWWDPAHTYSGDAARLAFAAQPGGCWCESLPDGGFVEHGRVLQARPGRLLRVQGALGPLQELGVAAVLDFALAPAATVDGVGGTRVTLTYVVGGHAPRGFEGLAKPVDAVLGAALARYARNW